MQVFEGAGCLDDRILLTYHDKGSVRSVLEEGGPATLVDVLQEGRSGSGQGGFQEWRNLLIQGENLRVMRELIRRPDVSGQVRLVYIDPPFGVNHDWRGGRERVSTVSASKSDEVAYEDRRIGASYLEFLRERLILLRELMSDDGSIYVHIDSKMGHYVKVLLDEVFGSENFINDIARVKCNPKNFERRGYGNFKDMVFLYSKSDEFIWNGATEPHSEEEIHRLFAKTDALGRRYTTNPLHAPGETKDGPTGREWKGLKPPKGRHWRYAPSKLTELDEMGLIEWSTTGNPRKIIFADDFRKKEKKVQDVWFLKDPAYPSYPTEKNLEMLERIVAASSMPDDLVLDCFAGSGTTLVAAESLNRRWIGIDDSELALDASLKRLRSLRGVSPFKVLRERI